MCVGGPCVCCAGREEVWPLLILVEVGPALVSLLILPLLPETPRYLLLVRQNRDAARKGLRCSCVVRCSSVCASQLTTGADREVLNI